MKTILVCPSDHGYGHTIRSVALLRSIIKENPHKRLKIVVTNYNAYSILKGLLPQVEIRRKLNDVGPQFNLANNHLDSSRTFSSMWRFIKREKQWLDKEIYEAKKMNTDLVISDISPMAIRLAKKIRCPAVCVASFSWLDILEKIEGHKLKEKIVDWLYESFSFSDLTIKLSMSMRLTGLPNIKKGSILARVPTETRAKVIKKLGVRTDNSYRKTNGANSPQKIVCMYLGTQQQKPRFHLTEQLEQRRLSFVLMSRGRLYSSLRPKPINYSEGQDIISNSIMVVGKIGYMTLSEAIKFRVPFFFLQREGYPEDTFLAKAAQRIGIGFPLNDTNSSSNQLQISNLKFSIPTFSELNDISKRIDENTIKKMENLPSPQSLVSEFL